MNISHLCRLHTSIVIFVLLLLGCGENLHDGKHWIAYGKAPVSVQPPQPLQIDKNEVNGITIRMSIIENWDTDTTHCLMVRSIYEGEDVGFILALPSRQKLNNRIGNGIAIRGVGPDSDEFLQLLARLYRQPLDKSARFVDSIEPIYIDRLAISAAIVGSVTDSTGELDYTLFFRRDDDSEVAELALNIDASEQWLELRETDTADRQKLIHLLSRPGKNSDNK
jgi:hypothetical protein